MENFSYWRQGRVAAFAIVFLELSIIFVFSPLDDISLWKPLYSRQGLAVSSASGFQILNLTPLLMETNSKTFLFVMSVKIYLLKPFKTICLGLSIINVKILQIPYLDRFPLEDWFKAISEKILRYWCYWCKIFVKAFQSYFCLIFEQLIIQISNPQSQPHTSRWPLQSNRR